MILAYSLHGLTYLNLVTIPFAFSLVLLVLAFRIRRLVRFVPSNEEKA